MKYDIKKVPRELLEEFILKHTAVLDTSIVELCTDTGTKIRKAAEVPLRTKAEVDADIVRLVRDYVKEYVGLDVMKFDRYLDGLHTGTELGKLVREETSD